MDVPPLWLERNNDTCSWFKASRMAFVKLEFKFSPKHLPEQPGTLFHELRQKKIVRLVILIFGLFFCLSFFHLLLYLIILSLSPWLNLNFSDLQSIASLTSSQTMPFVVRFVSLTQGSSTLFSHRSGKTTLSVDFVVR